jgi:VIT1/CCC1 family predicted Fe2+/Mn2+ transporter
MAAGEYVSVSSQADTEHADLTREETELQADPAGELDELAARPLQAALASAATFAVGAGLPLLTAMLATPTLLAPLVAAASLACLAGLGAIAARTGGASAMAGARRVAFWGALAMGVTAAAGSLFGTVV